MTHYQPGIIAPIPRAARYLEYDAIPDKDPAPVMQALAARAHDAVMIIGLGAGLVQRLGHSIPGLHPFPAISGAAGAVPSTQADLWCWIGGEDPGRITHQSRAVSRILRPAFRLERQTDGFRYGSGLDLTGYEDGTENPQGAAALKAAILRQGGTGLEGSSFVAIQQWRHDLDHFESLAPAERDNIFGRRLADNEEFDDAPASAHVKRVAQETFEPEAFVVRRSMPWADAHGEGLMFVAFGASPAAFEALLGRMTGQEDGVTDGLFRFSRPLTGSHFWCPPLADGHLDLTAVGIMP